MSRWLAFEEICAFLREGLLGGQRAQKVAADWEPIIEISNLQLVTPAVAWILKDRPGLPLEVREYFETVHLLNSKREEAILDALAIALQQLNKVGIEPILLKGAAHLVEKLYPRGTRLVGDVDMLVAPDQAEQTTMILLKAGYEKSSEPLPPGHRHLPVLHDRRSGLAIELHTRIEQDADTPVLPLAWFTAENRLVDFRGRSARLPGPTQLVGHNFVHHRVNDVSRPAPVELRWLLDMALIRRRFEGEIDWKQLDQFCVCANQGTALATYLAFGESFLGQVAPQLAARPDRNAMQTLREHIEPAERRPGLDIDVVSYSFSGAEAEQVSGHCWRIRLPDEFLPGDTDAATRRSALQLYLGEEMLGPAHAPHSVIERIGQGSYAHRGQELFFSTPNNSAPRVSDNIFFVKSWLPASADLLRTIRSREAQLADASSKLTEALRQLSETSRQLSDASKQLSEQLAVGHALRQEMQEMKSSMFWRLRLRLQRYPHVYRALSTSGRRLWKLVRRRTAQ